MPNELIWLFFIFFDLGAALIAIRLYGKVALYAIIIVNIILCNLQVLKLVDLFGFTVTLGNIAYGSVFMATDLLVECYGKQEARKAVNLSLYALVFITIALQITVHYTPRFTIIIILLWRNYLPAFQEWPVLVLLPTLYRNIMMSGHLAGGKRKPVVGICGLEIMHLQWLAN